jgi:GT2 family glycosyltransferase
MSVSPTSLPPKTTPTEPRLLPVGGVITASCRLSDYLLLLVGSIGVARGDTCEFWRFCDGRWMKLDTTVLALSTTSGDDDALILVREPRVGTDFPAGSLVVHTETDEIALEPVDLEETFVDVATIARQHLGTGDEGAAAALLAGLLRGSANERRSRRRLSESLFEIREIVRKPLARATTDPAEPRIAQVDAVWRLDDKAVYVQGWMKNEEAELTSLVAMSPEGERIELIASVFRYHRPDVAEFFLDGVEEQTRPAGFVAFVELAHPSLREDGWILELRDSAGGAVEAPMPGVSLDAGAARAAILADFALESPDERQLKDGHLSPAIDRLEDRRRRGVAIGAVDQHGTPPDSPCASIIVPLFRRVEFLEQQMAQFVHDPEIAASDLVYVLDSPEDAEYLRSFAHDLYDLYGVPFRLAVLTKNGGYSAVNNLGANLARGRLLLLLNSDVIPDRPGWLAKLVEFYDGTPGIGALSPKLLYEDESIQHAGLYFQFEEQVWSKEHLFSGLHRDLPAANVTRPVPAVTGACLMISKALYDEVGGLRTDYIQGGYEDSDLCLRLAEAGRSSWYLPTVALYHLEGQSYPSTEGELESRYNRWLHSRIWGERIPELTGQLAVSS